MTKIGKQWFPLDVDFDRDPKIMDLTLQEGPIGQLIYIKCLCFLYTRPHGLCTVGHFKLNFPAHDPVQIERILRHYNLFMVRTTDNTPLDDDLVANKRVKEELDKLAGISAKRSVAGKAGAAARKYKETLPTVDIDRHFK